MSPKIFYRNGTFDIDWWTNDNDRGTFDIDQSISNVPIIDFYGTIDNDQSISNVPP